MRLLVHEYVGGALAVLTMFQSEHVRGKENRILALFKKKLFATNWSPAVCEDFKAPR